MKSCFPPGRRFSAAFTLVEILVVIVIIAILATLAIPVVNKVIAKVHATQVKATMLELQSGISRYRQENNRFPIDPSLVATTDEDAPAFQTDGSVDIINILTANTDPRKTPNLNSKRITYVNLPLARNGSYGVVDNSNGETEGAPLELRDLWGQPYHVLLDTDYDKRVKNPDRENGDPTIRRNPRYLSGDALLYSAGPDKIPLTRDDITSWR
jgi:prepilin-type N-terminal cleavage/methylation domain-containing protein